MSEYPSAMGSFIESIRINAISREVRNGRALLVKRRRIGSGLAARTANLFFRMANYPASVWEKVAQWQRWEVECFNLLHGSQCTAFADGPRTVCADILPGASLAEHAVNGTLSLAMMEAAALELRRAHELPSREFTSVWWSHGDANLTNFLFAAAENRARLIDFEIIHDRALPSDERHAEDLLTFLQDLLGSISGADWLPFACRFVTVYGSGAAMDRLRERLAVPTRIPQRLWWWVRTNYIPGEQLRKRVSELRDAMS